MPSPYKSHLFKLCAQNCYSECTYSHEEAEEAAIEYDVGVEAATGVDAGVSSAGVSKADEGDTKLSFFFRNSSLRLALLLIVEGLGFFLMGAWLSKASSLESKEKGKTEVRVREDLKALP